MGDLVMDMAMQTIPILRLNQASLMLRWQYPEDIGMNT